MYNINKVMIAGNLTKQPELKSLPSGSYVCSFSLATNRTWKDKNGQKQEEVDYINCVLFGKTAEAFAQYGVKGQNFLIEGRIKNRSWKKDDGSMGYATDIICDTFHFGQKPQGSAKPKNEDNLDDGWERFANVPDKEPSIDYGEVIDPNLIPF